MLALAPIHESGARTRFFNRVDFVGVALATLYFDDFLVAGLRLERTDFQFPERATTLVDTQHTFEVFGGRLALRNVGNDFVAVEQIRMIGLTFPVPLRCFKYCDHALLSPIYQDISIIYPNPFNVNL